MAGRTDSKVVQLDAHRPTRPNALGLTRVQRQILEVAALLQTAVGALNDIRLVLQRMRALAILAAHDGITASSRSTIQAPLRRHADELDRIATGTVFNARRLLDGSFKTEMAFRVGAEASVALAFTIQAVTPEALGLAEGDGLSVSAGDDAKRAVLTVEAAIETVSAQQAEIGVVIDRLFDVITGLGFEAENLSARETRLTELARAAAMTNLLKAQILRQPAAALRSQAPAMRGLLLRFPAQSLPS